MCQVCDCSVLCVQCQIKFNVCSFFKHFGGMCPFYSLGDLKLYMYVKGLTHAMVLGSHRDTWGLSYPASLRIAQTKELTDTHRLWLFSEL